MGNLFVKSFLPREAKKEEIYSIIFILYKTNTTVIALEYGSEGGAVRKTRREALEIWEVDTSCRLVFQLNFSNTLYRVRV